MNYPKNSLLSLYIITFCLVTLVLSCDKHNAEKVYGTWHEINNTEDMDPTGCEFVVDKESEEITLCGFKYVQPSNSVAVFASEKAKLNIKNGRISYHQKRTSIFWMIPIGGKEHYFIDYAFEGDFLWIMGNDSDTWVDPTGIGRVFTKY